MVLYAQHHVEDIPFYDIEYEIILEDCHYLKKKIIEFVKWIIESY